MHAYSVDKRIRIKIAIGLFVVSIAVSMFLRTMISSSKCVIFVVTTLLTVAKMNEISEFLSSTGIFPNFLEAAVIYSMLSFFYEKSIWKCTLIRPLHGIPNLNGTWRGKLQSSFSCEPIDMELVINQTWSEISFISTFPQSTSYSNTAAIHMEDNRGISIYFGYHNESSDTNTGMQSYDGYNILTLKDKDTIVGRYFNNRPNPDKSIKGGNMGSFSLHRVACKKTQKSHKKACE